MNLRSIIVVALRLMALNWLVQGSVQIPLRMLDSLRAHSSSTLDASSAYLLPWLVLGAWAGGAGMVWFLAPPIAQVVTRGVKTDISIGSLTLTDCYTLAFMVTGLFYIAGHLAQVLNWLHFLLTTASNSPNRATFGYEISQAFIPFIIGVVLFVKSRTWAAALARKPNETKDTGAQTTDG